MADKPDAGAALVLTNALTSATVHLAVSGTEVGGGVGYSAQPWGSIAFSPADTAVQAADIVFGTSTGSWGTVDEVWIKKSGVKVYVKALTPTAIASGNVVKFTAGSITIQET